MWPEEVPQSLSSLFKFTKVAIDVAEVAVHGEFHLYQLSEHPEDLEVLFISQFHSKKVFHVNFSIFNFYFFSVHCL